MKGLFVRYTKGNKGTVFFKPGTFGFGTIELLTTLGMLGILVGLAAASYDDAVEKRRLAQGAELIVAFVNTIQSESIKRNREITVAYTIGDGGQWCIGARLGQTACDCMETDPAEASWCGLHGAPWVLRHDDVSASNLIQSMSGDGAYVFDPVRGLFTDPDDILTLGLSAGEGQYQVSVSVDGTGRVSACVPEASSAVHGFQSCPQGR